MQMRISSVLLACLFILISFSPSPAFELKTRYATITYNSEEHLRKFNKEISLGSLSYLLRNKKSFTVDDEIKDKIDVIVERVEAILEMFPKELRFSISLHPAEEEVQGIYKKRYGKDVDFIAFYSPKDKVLYVSVKDIDLGVLAHEIAHAIIDIYYGKATPSKIHEVLAQYVESHLKD
jgi:hypothetical protein